MWCSQGVDLQWNRELPTADQRGLKCAEQQTQRVGIADHGEASVETIDDAQRTQGRRGDGKKQPRGRGTGKCRQVGAEEVSGKLMQSQRDDGSGRLRIFVCQGAIA